VLKVIYIKLHRRLRQTVLSYSLSGTNVTPMSVPMCPLMRAHWRHLANMIELVLPSAHPESTTQMANRLVQPFLRSSRQKVFILYNGHPFPPKLPLLMGESADLDPCLTPYSLAPF